METTTRSTFIYTADSFNQIHSLPSHPVPLYHFTDSNRLARYGRLVSDFATEQVTRVSWPRPPGARPLVPGTGNQQALIVEDYVVRWKGDILHADNLGVSGELGHGFAIGRTGDSEKRDELYVRDVNYHPDGSQVFMPQSCRAFVMLLAPEGDDVTPDKFEAFLFDGSCGFNISPNVWHTTPMFSGDDVIKKPNGVDVIESVERDVTKEGFGSDVGTLVFGNKQSSVFACVQVDTVNEFGKFLRVPLHLPLAAT